VNYARHGHAFTADDWTAMLDFFDHHLRGKPAARAFDRFPTAPELDEAAVAARFGAISTTPPSQPGLRSVPRP